MCNPEEMNRVPQSEERERNWNLTPSSGCITRASRLLGLLNHRGSRFLAWSRVTRTSSSRRRTRVALAPWLMQPNRRAIKHRTGTHLGPPASYYWIGPSPWSDIRPCGGDQWEREPRGRMRAHDSTHRGIRARARARHPCRQPPGIAIRADPATYLTSPDIVTENSRPRTCHMPRLSYFYSTQQLRYQGDDNVTGVAWHGVVWCGVYHGVGGRGEARRDSMRCLKRFEGGSIPRLSSVRWVWLQCAILHKRHANHILWVQ